MKWKSEETEGSEGAELILQQEILSPDRAVDSGTSCHLPGKTTLGELALGPAKRKETGEVACAPARRCILLLMGAILADMCAYMHMYVRSP